MIEFLQAFCQSQWFKGHDRLQIPDNHAPVLNKRYFAIFKGLGLTQPIYYNVSEKPPDFL